MRITAAVVLATALLVPATASADGAAQLTRDCQDGRVDGSFTAAEHEKALRELPNDVDEYTDCRGAIRASQLRIAAAGGAKAAPGSADRRELGTGVRASGGTQAPETGVQPAAPSAPPAPAAPATATAPGPVGLPAAPAPAPAAPPVVEATSSAQDVPPTLAGGLAVVGAGLLGAGVIGSRRRRAG